MKRQITKYIQQTFFNIALNSIGKSVPIFMHERKVPDEVAKYKAIKTKT